jgi:predicted MPP superfamily phosphohydrolase
MTTKKITIQVYSDIHLEYWNKLPSIPVKAKYLFLAGDICRLKHPLFLNFFDYCSANWVKVFYVPGNHEFYDKNKNYNELSFEYKYFLSTRYKNVFYLDNEFISLDDSIDVYGATFWTMSPFYSKNDAKIYINDYNNITYFNEGLNKVIDLDTSYINKLSNNSFISLQTYLNTTNKYTIVMTHFPPISSGTSNPKFIKELEVKKKYFSWPDDTLDKLNLFNVPLWISGHTHWSYDFEKFNTKFISNQLGYKEELGETGINENGLFQIEVIS